MTGSKRISLFVAIFSLFLVGAVSTDSASAMTIEELCDPTQPGAIVAGPGEINLIGTDGDDILIGNELDNKIKGKKGADILCGGDGNDILRGGHANDILLGQAGSDKFHGEHGIDTCDLSTEDFNERNCELEFGGQDLGGDSFFDIIVESFGTTDNFLNQFQKSDGTFNVDSFFDVFVDIGDLDAEKAARIAADEALQNQADSFFDVFVDIGDLDAEKAARIAADEALQNQADSFFDVFTEISVHDTDVQRIDTELVALDLRGQSCAVGYVVTGIDVSGAVTCAVDAIESGSGSNDWNDLINVPAGFADGVDDDNQLTQSQVDNFVSNNNFLIRDCTNLSPNAFLLGCNLRGATLSGVDLSDANLSNADLSDANLFNADLGGVVLFNADLSNTNLSGADLSNANFSHVNLSDANLRGANLSGTLFCSIDFGDNDPMVPSDLCRS